MRTLSISVAVLLGACAGGQPQPYDPVTASMMMRSIEVNNANQRATNDGLTTLFTPRYQPPPRQGFNCYSYGAGLTSCY